MQIGKYFFSAIRQARGLAGRGGQRIAKAQPDEIILIQPLDAEESEYEFNLSDSLVDTVSPIAKGLSFRNNFVVSGISIGVLRVPVLNNKVMWGATFPVYWEDPNVFDIAAGGANNLTESQAIASVWNGKITFKPNESVKFNNVPTLGFRTVHETQKGGVTDGTNGFSTSNMFNGEEIKTLGGNIKLAGGNTNILTLKINCLDKTLIGGGTSGSVLYNNYVHIRLVGAAIKGGTVAELQGK